MSSLLRFPNELLLKIIEELQEDVEAFALTCTQLNFLAATHLRRHRIFKRKYSQISCGFRRGAGTMHEKIPLEILLDIARDESIARYPKKVTIRKPSKIPSRIRDLPLDQFRAEIQAKVAACLFWNKEQKKRHGAEILRGCFVPAVTLLLTLLPNIEELNFEHCSTPNQQLLRMIKKINSCRPYTNTHVLTKLSALGIHGTSSEQNRIEKIKPFLSLPSLQTFRATSLVENFDTSWGDMGSFSNLRHIDLKESLVSSWALSSFIKLSSSIRTFSYEMKCDHGNDIFAQSSPHRIITSLQEHSSRSLESLTLIMNRDSNSKITLPSENVFGSFDAFGMLASIHLDASIFIDPGHIATNFEHIDRKKASFSLRRSSITGIPSRRLVDILPRSAKSLILEGWIHGELMTEMLRYYLEHRKRRRHFTLKIKSDYVFPDDVCQDCLAAGVKFCSEIVSLDLIGFAHLIGLRKWEDLKDFQIAYDCSGGSKR